MELEELKRQWQVLNSQLKQMPLTEDNEIERLIASYRQKTSSSLGHLKSLQRFSVSLGVACMGILIIIGISLCNLENEAMRMKYIAMTAFAVLSFLLGIVWDMHVYSRLKQIRVDTMSVLQVSRLMVSFRQLMKTEVWAAIIWAVVFIIFYSFLFDVYSPWWFLGMSAGCGIFGYFYYKKLVYKHLDNIKKNVNELKDVVG